MCGIKITATKKGLNIEARNEKFNLSYDEANMHWLAGKKWCEKKGGILPTLTQLAIIYEFFETINTSLRLQGKTELSRAYYWSSFELYSIGAWYASFGSGGIYSTASKVWQFRIRSITTFQ